MFPALRLVNSKQFNKDYAMRKNQLMKIIKNNKIINNLIKTAMSNHIIKNLENKDSAFLIKDKNVMLPTPQKYV